MIRTLLDGRVVLALHLNGECRTPPDKLPCMICASDFPDGTQFILASPKEHVFRFDGIGGVEIVKEEKS